MRPTAGETLVAGPDAASKGEVALGECAVERDGVVEVVGQLGTVITDAHFELHGGWIRADGLLA